MKKIFLIVTLFSFLCLNVNFVEARDFLLKAVSKQADLNFQDLPEFSENSPFVGHATEIDSSSYDNESKGDKTMMIVLSVIAGGMALGGIMVPILLK